MRAAGRRAGVGNWVQDGGMDGRKAKKNLPWHNRKVLYKPALASGLAGLGRMKNNEPPWCKDCLCKTIMPRFKTYRTNCPQSTSDRSNIHHRRIEWYRRLCASGRCTQLFGSRARAGRFCIGRGQKHLPAGDAPGRAAVPPQHPQHDVDSRRRAVPGALSPHSVRGRGRRAWSCPRPGSPRAGACG